MGKSVTTTARVTCDAMVRGENCSRVAENDGIHAEGFERIVIRIDEATNDDPPDCDGIVRYVCPEHGARVRQLLGLRPDAFRR